VNIEQLPQSGTNNLWFRYNASDAALVFVHGVLSDSRGCWLHHDKKHSEKSRYWPDLIASDSRFNNVSIYLAGYYTAPDSGPYEIRNCADEVFKALKRKPSLHSSLLASSSPSFPAGLTRLSKR